MQEHAAAEQGVAEAESLLAEAMQMRAGDRTFIGQIEQKVTTMAEQVRPGCARSPFPFVQIAMG